MASRPVLPPYQIVTNGSMSADIVSPVTILTNLSMVSYSVSWVGTSPIGVITIEASNDYSVNGAGVVSNAGTWNTLPLSTTCNVSGNSGNGMIDIDSMAGYAIRLRYTRASGTGEMQVVVTGKVK